jgi:hypothetical protein
MAPPPIGCKRHKRCSAWSDGDRALQGLTLSSMSSAAWLTTMGAAPGPHPQTTALVVKPMRLVDYKRMQWQNRAHFCDFGPGDGSDTVDHARSHNVKRGRVCSMSLWKVAVVGGDQTADRRWPR